MSYNFGAQEKCTLLFVSFPYCTPVCAKDTLLPINFLIMWGTLMSCHENEPYCFLTAGIRPVFTVVVSLSVPIGLL